MGIRDWFRRPATGAPAAPRAAVQQSGGGVTITTADDLERYLRDGEANSASGAVVTAQTAMRNAAVYGCVRIIAGKAATLPVDVKRRVDDRTREDATDHSVWALMNRRPNKWMRPGEFKRMMTAHMLLRGNAYCRIVRGGIGNRDVLALLPLQPDRVAPRQRPTGEIEYVHARPDGARVTLAQRDVFHLKGMSLDGIRGVSVIAYARETIGLALATARHGSTFFRNGTNVGSVIQHPAKIGKEGLEFLHDSLDKYRSGGDSEGKTLILEEDAKFQHLGMSMEDAAFIETMRMSRTDIAMFFGVPPHMLGDTEKSTSWGTGIEQQSLGFVAYTLEDWLTAWEEAITVDLMRPDERDIYVRYNRNALIRGDIKARWDAYTKALQWGVFSPNEVRTLEDQNPREGGDEYYDPPNTAGGSDTSKGNDDEPPPAT